MVSTKKDKNFYDFFKFVILSASSWMAFYRFLIALKFPTSCVFVRNKLSFLELKLLS